MEATITQSTGTPYRKRPAGLLVCLLVAIGFMAPEAEAVTLSPLNPVTVDTTALSVDDNTEAMIKFFNDCHVAVDIYWIDYNGDRVLYFDDLAPGQSVLQGTYLTHPWLAVESGTGESLVEGTGKLIAGFLAQTPNSFTSQRADEAHITCSVPDGGSTFALLGCGVVMSFAGRRWLVKRK